ncbi:MAG: sensor domain-containing diguanylate cyclase [Oscillochloris sp.]|nr:sensor domain-containing diguanylate cyclase [Oscillochloris sp.]
MLIEQSSCLIALIDAHGELIEANAHLRQLMASCPNQTSIYAFLEPNSRKRFQQQLTRALHKERSEPTRLHFTDSPLAIAQSYRCFVLPASSSQVVLLAEPIAPLDQRAAEEYIHVTNELAATTRALQKTSHELVRKQQALEEALQTIEQIARIDDLTRILNRRSIMLTLADEFDRVRRYPSTVSILLIDIDHFKQVNDRYGHPMGDEVLRDCAGLLRRSIRTIDHIGRYGGEEFLCVLPMTSEEQATELAERLRRDVANARFIVAETTTFSVTISIGVAEIDPERDTPELLIAHADNALYQAKARGRDQLAIWRP